ncbi:MAG: SusC/RagA family TonB-linked outer membrane protein, partial [Bacteroidota bacterium]
MKKVFLHIISVLLIVMGSMDLFAQTRIITGTAKDSNGDAIIGASILVKGTTVGTYTDVNGGFSLAVTPDAKILVVRYLGMKTQEIALGASNTLDIKMEDDVPGLDEVVVTAIGVTKEKKSLGYSVQDVGGDALTQAGQSNALTALSGKVAGLSIIQSSGSPGGSVDIKIRGATSLSGSNAPLIIVDGVPLDNAENFSGNPDDLSNNYLQSVNNSNRAVDINPDDIESVSVLKGPAATALYGISAANGALIITTKKGGKKAGGGINITYSTNMSWEKVNKLPELQNQFVKGTGGQIRSYESGTSGSWGAAGDTIFWDPNQTSLFNKNGELVGKTDAHYTDSLAAFGLTSANPDSLIATMPFSPFDNVGTFFKTGHTWENNLSLSGGSDVSAFRFSFSSLKQEGIVPNADFKRYTAKMSGQTKLSSKMSASGSATYSNSGGLRIQQGSNTSGLMLGLLRTPISFDNSNGVTDVTDPAAYILADGRQRNYRGGGGYDNPYWTINQSPFNDNVNRVYGYGQVDYLPVSWLNLTYRLGTDNYSDYRKQYFAIGSRTLPGGQIFIQQFNYFHLNSDIIATATKKFSDNLDGGLTIGQNMYSQRSKSIYTQGDDLIFPDFQNMSVASTVLTREGSSRYRTSAMYLAGSLAFKSMLYLNITGRNEMSSTLPKDKNAFFYPSVNLGWVFTESFGMSSNKILPYGKIRASWASVGKDAPPYALETYYDQAAFSDGWTPGIPFPVDGVVGYSNYYILGNPLLKPEKVNSTEIGAELKFLNNRIGIEFTYYMSKSLDQILATPVPGSSGYQYMYQNTGELSNKGMEI